MLNGNTGIYMLIFMMLWRGQNLSDPPSILKVNTFQPLLPDLNKEDFPRHDESDSTCIKGWILMESIKLANNWSTKQIPALKEETIFTITHNYSLFYVVFIFSN